MIWDINIVAFQSWVSFKGDKFHSIVNRDFVYHMILNFVDITDEQIEEVPLCHYTENTNSQQHICKKKKEYIS